MSSNRKESRKKKLNQENEVINTFIDKKQAETSEPLTKKNKVNDDNSADDSLKFFKSLQVSKTSVKSSTTSTSNVVSDFINKPSTSKQANAKKKKEPSKSKRNTKPKAQTDIRQALSKQDRLLYHAIDESCTEDGVDPYEMQLALAISESLKDMNSESLTTEQELKESKNFENPFAATGKIQSISTVLERYGFKSKKVYSEYEIEMIMNNKSSKRSKYQKCPTLLTSTTGDKRNEMIRCRIDDILDSPLFLSKESKKFPKYNPIVYSDYLETLHQKNGIVFSKSSAENMILNDYYVTELFEPSNVKAGHLLKDWSSIVGRDPSPVKECAKEKSFDKQEKLEDDKNEEIVSLNSSCSDIFDGVESFSLDQTEDAKNTSFTDQLSLLHEKLSQLANAPEINVEEKIKSIDLTQQNDSTDSDSTVEYVLQDEASEKEIFDLTQRKPPIVHVKSESQDSSNDTNLEQSEEVFDLTQCDSQKKTNNDEIFECNTYDLTQSECEIVDISDEEINYSINRLQGYDEIGENYSSNNCLTQSEGSCSDLMEIDNIVDHSLLDIMPNDNNLKIDNSVSELLTNFNENRKSSTSFTRKNRSARFMENENYNDSIADIMKKYGVVSPQSTKNKTFEKIQSESDLNKYSQHSVEQIEEKIDLTVINDVKSSENDSIEIDEDMNESDMNLSINKSLANILKSPIISQTGNSTKPKARRSLGIAMNDKYLIDIESLFIEPDFSNMTPVELKQELFKFGIRPLPVKKAVDLLRHIYNQMHPKIRIAMDEEIDLDDTRRDMNITDVVTDIGMKGSEDEFVFQLNQSGILDNEEYILPKMKKSKIPSCLIPLHISFYNMIRSSEKLQMFILEYRPLDLDEIYRHFRKFNLTYQLNDIIAFLDKRCITFKTKEQSYSKRHERKKQKRTQKINET